MLTHTADGNVETYKAPSGTVRYTYSKTNSLESLTDLFGQKTGYEYNANDSRIKVSYPGGTVQSISRDRSNRATAIKATSPKGTLMDLSYTYAYSSGSTTKDGTKIRIRTDAQAGLKRTYDYDSAGHLTFTKET
ncbi:hypothetical protein ACFWY6_26990 [Streptomyces sp. NPDC059037]|uniref:hypothetical protein n=1 Tax=Streptomyces sp. NPDC059037 TaxID=3346710 RepID=UPI0036C85914